MRTRIPHIATLLCLLLLPLNAAAAVKKNTWVTRAYHYTTARYNTLFNGRQAFEKGDRAVWEANKDNYTRVLPLYAVSNHDNASVASSDTSTLRFALSSSSVANFAVSVTSASVAT